MNSGFIRNLDGALFAVIALCAVLEAVPAAAQSESASPSSLQTVTIIGQRADRVSSGATGLDLDVKDTPQSISVVNSQQMEDFGATNINDALRLSTGINVDAWETNRTTYSARGFDIANTQIDGVGMPNDWGIVSGAMDSYGYDKIEVIRGANGLLTGVGNAAGTINFVRKRPTNDEQGEVGVSYGSWGNKRIEADYSTPFTSDGSWAGRVVAAHEEGGSYLQDYNSKRDFLYGVVDGQIGDRGTLTAGYSYQQADSTGVMWGALTFMNNDGTQAEWPRNATTTQDWTNWNTNTQTAFVEYTNQLAGDWQLKLSYNYRGIDNDTKLFYAYLNGAGLDPNTGAGLAGYAWGGKDTLTENMGAATVNGHFNLLGREHEALFGVSIAKSNYTSNEYAGATCGADPCGAIPLPGFPYSVNLVPEPVWGGLSEAGHLNQQIKRAFGATRLTLTDRLKAVLGVNYAEYTRDGDNYGVNFDQTESEASPYAGLTYDFTDSVLGYVSYSDIYLPQSQVDANNNYLNASRGSNIEAGTKVDWLDKRLLTTLAVFQAKQSGLATPNGTYNSYGQAVYIPVDVTSTGAEFEATGKLNHYLDLVFGYTTLELTGADGSNTYPWVPRQTANLALSGRVPNTPWSLGMSGRWQSDISNEESSGFTARQDSYAVFNAFAAWRLAPKTTLRFNVNNLTDEKYINTLRYAGYYGAPRSFEAALNYQF